MLREHWTLNTFGGLPSGTRIGMLSQLWGLNVNGVDLTDPRTASDKAFHYLLARTQSRRTNLGVRMFERTLRSLGW